MEFALDGCVIDFVVAAAVATELDVACMCDATGVALVVAGAGVVRQAAVAEQSTFAVVAFAAIEYDAVEDYV